MNDDDMNLANKMIEDWRRDDGVFVAARLPGGLPDSGTDANIAALVARGIAIGRAEGMRKAANDMDNTLRGIADDFLKLAGRIADEAK